MPRKKSAWEPSEKPVFYWIILLPATIAVYFISVLLGRLLLEVCKFILNLIGTLAGWLFTGEEYSPAGELIIKGGFFMFDCLVRGSPAFLTIGIACALAPKFRRAVAIIIVLVYLTFGVIGFVHEGFVWDAFLTSICELIGFGLAMGIVCSGELDQLDQKGSA